MCRYIRRHAYLLPLFCTALHVHITEKIRKPVSGLPQAEKNHNEVHETTTPYAKYYSNHWKQEAIASRTKTHNLMESFLGTWKTWHELRGECFYHARLRGLTAQHWHSTFSATIHRLGQASNQPLRQTYCICKEVTS